jgi:hypothetical protein
MGTYDISNPKVAAEVVILPRRVVSRATSFIDVTRLLLISIAFASLVLSESSIYEE